MKKNASNMFNRGRVRLTAVLMAAALSLLASTPSFAQNLILHRDVVRGGGTDVYQMTFVGGEVELLEVRGDGRADLDLYVYDSLGDLVIKDVRLGSYAGVRWIPCCTETFTVRIVNRGTVASRYVLSTN